MQQPLIAQADDSVLVVIDLQERLAAAMPEQVRERVLSCVEIMLTATEMLSVPVMATEQYPKGLGHTEPRLKPYLDERVSVIEKTCFSCQTIPLFSQQLSATQRKQVFLVGMEAHICVLQTAMDLQANGYQVFVIEDAVSSRAQSNHDNAMHRLRQAGVVVTNVESVIFEWLRDASHSQFKALSRLIV